MEKKIVKQREKIEKLLHKKSDLDLKIRSVEDEISEEKETLQNLEKDYVASYMSEHALTAEKVIEMLSERQEVEIKQEEVEESEFDEYVSESINDDNNSKSFWR